MAVQKCLMKDCKYPIFLKGFCWNHSKDKVLCQYKLDLSKMNKKVKSYKKKKLVEFCSQQKEYAEIRKIQINYIKHCRLVKRGGNVHDNGKRKPINSENNSGNSRLGGVERFRQERELLF